MVDPLNDAIVPTDEKLVGIPRRVAAARWIADHDSPGAPRADGQFVNPGVLHLGSRIPHEMERENEPILVVDKVAVGVLELLHGLPAQLTAEIVELDGLALLVRALEADAILLHFPYPGTRHVDFAPMHV